MAIARKISEFITQASFIRKMFEEGMRLKQRYGNDNVFDFSLGNPNLEPPETFREQLRSLVCEEIPGKHMYMPNAGYPETRAAVAQSVNESRHTSLTEQHIVMTCGAGGALNVILKTLLNPGEEVIIPAPFFVEYRFYVDNAGGVTRILPTREDFSLDIESLRKAITDKTKAVLINSPNNPTGKVYREDSIRQLAELLSQKEGELRREIYLISDEPYSEIVYDGITVPSVLNHYRNSIIASSYSKCLSLPGERIGFIAVNREIAATEEMIGGLTLCNRILGFVNAPALMQRVIACLQGVSVDAEQYRKKRDLLCDGLTSVGYTIVKPEGAFYLFLPTPIPDDVRFADALMEHRILTVPGSGFFGPGHIRIAYCVDDTTIVGAIDGFGKVLKKFR